MRSMLSPVCIGGLGTEKGVAFLASSAGWLSSACFSGKMGLALATLSLPALLTGCFGELRNDASNALMALGYGSRPAQLCWMAR
jgi:hypothetical protein